jgi:hypothetical protein
LIPPRPDQPAEANLITCRIGERELQYQLTHPVQRWQHPAGWTVHRHQARSVSASSNRFTADQWIVELYDLADYRLAEQLLQRFERFYRLGLPGWAELAGGGRVVSQPYFGWVVIVYPRWQTTLAEQLARAGPMSEADAQSLLHQLAAALFAAHNLGLTHGDLRGENVVGVQAGDGQNSQMRWQLALGLADPVNATGPTQDVRMLQELLVQAMGLASAAAAPPSWREVLADPPPPARDLLFAFRPRPIVGPIRVEPDPDHPQTHVRLHWPAVAGEVRFYDVSRSEGLHEGSVQPTAVLERLGEPLTVTREPSWTLPADGHAVLGVCVVDNVAVIGERIRPSTYPDVRDLTVSVRDGQGHATWAWPPDCRVAIVTVRSDRYALSPDDAPFQRSITRQEYEMGGGCRWLLPDRQADELFVVVFATAHPKPGHASGAFGARARVPTQQAHLRYLVRPRSSSGLRGLWQRLAGGSPGQSELVLLADEPLTLPELVLVADIGHAPESIRAGRIVLRLPAGARISPGQPLIVPFTLDSREPVWLRLFVEPGSGSGSGSGLRLDCQAGPGGIPLLPLTPQRRA